MTTKKAIQPKKKFGGRQEGSGRPKILFDPIKVEQIAMRCDSKADIALALGISYATLNRRQKDSESFESAIKRGQAKAKIFVTGKLMKLIEEGNPTAIIFWLKCNGWRETNRTELTGADGKPIQASVKNEGVDGWEQVFQKMKAPKKS